MKYCPMCGAKLRDGDRFCSQCGTSVGEPPPAGAEAQERTVAQDVRGSTLAQAGSAAADAGGIAVVGSVRDIIVGAGPSDSPAYLRAAYLSR